MTDIKKLRELANKASTGPWTVRCRNVKYYDGDTHVDLNTVIERFDPDDGNDADFLGAEIVGPAEAGRSTFVVIDAAYIAALNPTTVLSLLDTIERYERALKHISRYIDTAGCAKCDRAYPNVDRVEHLEKVALNALAPQALNPKEGG